MERLYLGIDGNMWVCGVPRKKKNGWLCYAVGNVGGLVTLHKQLCKVMQEIPLKPTVCGCFC